MAKKNTICLWYDGTALDAARFYAETFPDSAVGAVMRAPGDYPDGKQGDVLTVEFTVAGIPCIGLNGGPQFKHNEAFSFQIATDDQVETDRLWNAIVGNGGQESACGWCKDKWGLNWQITPRALIDAISDPDRAAANVVRTDPAAPLPQQPFAQSGIGPGGGGGERQPSRPGTRGSDPQREEDQIDEVAVHSRRQPGDLYV